MWKGTKKIFKAGVCFSTDNICLHLNVLCKKKVKLEIIKFVFIVILNYKIIKVFPLIHFIFVFLKNHHF